MFEQRFFKTEKPKPIRSLTLKMQTSNCDEEVIFLQE